MFGSAALSNHGVSSEYELWEHGNDGYYGEGGECNGYSGSFAYDPLYYHTNISAFCDILQTGDQFTVVRQRSDGLKLSIPTKIVKVRNGEYFAHRNIYFDILRKKKIWIAQQKSKEGGVE